jgi:hypothetical protein
MRVSVRKLQPLNELSGVFHAFHGAGDGGKGFNVENSVWQIIAGKPENKSRKNSTPLHCFISIFVIVCFTSRETLNMRLNGNPLRNKWCRR